MIDRVEEAEAAKSLYTREIEKNEKQKYTLS